MRKKIVVKGMVQGVGFRPFIFRLARGLGITGFVINTGGGVEIEAEGGGGAVDDFIRRISSDAPPIAVISDIRAFDIPGKGSASFRIDQSRGEQERGTLISPDIGICPDCLRELLDPSDRRFCYPFINCTNCGPRFTIIKDIPYDRPLTTMAPFTMCPDCLAEYEDPADRRFHAQPNACSVCGPRVFLLGAGGEILNVPDPPAAAGQHLKDGRILAVKGLGGYHLVCDARNQTAVRLLRRRKQRDTKPLAVMSADITEAASFSLPGPLETTLLQDPRRPIVLVKKRDDFVLSDDIAPDNGYVGLMLPYTPLHVLLLRYGPPTVVMTSGNLADEPIAADNDDAVRRLGTIADYFLANNRDIYQRADDSVFMTAAGSPRPVRRSRGCTPAPVRLRGRSLPLLATGADLKNTICFTRQNEAFFSQHIGDLEHAAAQDFFRDSIAHFLKILDVVPELIVHDLHPDYFTTRWAQEQDLPTLAVQHHHAHIASCLAENRREEKVIGLALDGTGYGPDGTVWGGEVLIADTAEFTRAAHFACRPLPGGDAAVREPWRMAVSYLWHALHPASGGGPDRDAFLRYLIELPFFKDTGEEPLAVVTGMILQNVHTVPASSLGRLFDGIAAIAGLRSKVTREGEAAAALEAALRPGDLDKNEYVFPLTDQDGILLISPDRAVSAAADDILNGESPARISLRFHRGLVTLFTDLCLMLRNKHSIGTAALSGGCFQNRYLHTELIHRLQRHGFEVLTHRQVPVNDGGISLGQAAVAAAKM